MPGTITQTRPVQTFTKVIKSGVSRLPVTAQPKFGINGTNNAKAGLGTLHIKNPNARQPH